MRKIRVFEHISLDGVIQNSRDDNGFPFEDWTGPYRSPAGRELVLSLQGERFDLLLGRRTYDAWSQYWPKAPKSPMADRLNAAKKFVVTHRPDSLAWGPHQELKNTSSAIKELKASDGLSLILWGSSTLTTELLKQGLVDELTLITYPVFLGCGKRLFTESTLPQSLELSSSQSLPTGIVVNQYRVITSA